MHRVCLEVLVHRVSLSLHNFRFTCDCIDVCMFINTNVLMLYKTHLFHYLNNHYFLYCLQTRCIQHISTCTVDAVIIAVLVNFNVGVSCGSNSNANLTNGYFLLSM